MTAAQTESRAAAFKGPGPDCMEGGQAAHQSAMRVEREHTNQWEPARPTPSGGGPTKGWLGVVEAHQPVGRREEGRDEQGCR